MDFALDDSFDIKLERGDLKFTDDVAQRLKARFRLWRGEWFTDQRAGFPWRQDVLGQKVDERLFKSLVFREASSDRGVKSVDGAEVQFESRAVTITLDVTVVDGQQERIEVTI